MTVINILEICEETLKTHSHLILIVIVCILSLVQIVPVKLNPLSLIKRLMTKLLGFVGRMFLSSVISDINSLKDRVELLSDVIDDNEIDSIRNSIFEFSGSCLRGENHTQRQFLYIFKRNKKYHDILRRLGEENGEIDREIEYLEDLYKQKEMDNSFLK